MRNAFKETAIMKRMLRLTLATGLAGALIASADSIRVAGVLYENVYVGTSRTAYYVHFPEDGRVEKISRARKDVESPEIDPDEESRAQLLARFEARKAENDQARATAESSVLEADTAGYLRRKALQETALFESQLAHWKDLSPEQQQAILESVLALSANQAARHANEKISIESRLEDLNTAKADRQFEIGMAQARRSAAVEEADRRNLSQLWRDAHEEEVIGYLRGNERYVSDFWLREADTEDAVAAHRKAAADQAYAREAAGHERALERVESAITRREREAVATENKARDADRRFAVLMGRIDELIVASSGPYAAQVAFHPVETWTGEGDLRTPAVVIEHEVWQVECRRNDFDVEGDFKITVMDAETDLPITAIIDRDMLRMRTCTIDGPGRYYFIVKQDRDKIPWELNVSGITARQ
jgi:hypothetical protein